jgi:hypothetical protein
MANRPKGGPEKYLYHRVADVMDPAWDDFDRTGDPSKVLTVIAVADDPRAQVEEYREAIVRIKDHLLTHRQNQLAKKAHQISQMLPAEAHRLKTGRDRYTHAEIAAVITKLLGRNIDAKELGRVLRGLDQALVEESSTHSRSLTNYREPLDSD